MTSVVVIGDATLDVTVAPSRPLRAGGDVPAIIRLGPGGQGANVAVRLARRGVAVTLVAPLAADTAGRLVTEALEREGVALQALPASRTATVVALLDASGERTMLSDRQPLAGEALTDVLGAAGWIHCSAYALLDDQEGDGLARTLGARPAAARLSIAGGSIPPEPSLVARFRTRIAAARPDLLVVNRDEAAALLGAPRQVARDAAQGVRDLAPLVIVTAGSQGSAATLDGRTFEARAPELAGPVLDATGSGDAYLAGLVAEVVGAAWPPGPDGLSRAMAAGSRAGGLVARVVGAQARTPDEPAGADR